MRPTPTSSPNPEYYDVVPPASFVDISHSSGTTISHFSVDLCDVGADVDSPDACPTTTPPASTEPPETTEPTTTETTEATTPPLPGAYE